MGAASRLGGGLIVAEAHGDFVRAVTRQLTRPPGAVGGELATSAARGESEAEVRAALDRLLRAAAAAPGSAPFTAAADSLRDDETLLSSVFQNLDLFGIDDPIGVGVALLVTAALEG